MISILPPFFRMWFIVFICLINGFLKFKRNFHLNLLNITTVKRLPKNERRVYCCNSQAHYWSSQSLSKREKMTFLSLK